MSFYLVAWDQICLAVLALLVRLPAQRPILWCQLQPLEEQTMIARKD